MKCPHCHYFHGWSGEKLKNIEGSKGSFFGSPVKLERRKNWEPNEQRTLYACPKCRKTFIDL